MRFFIFLFFGFPHFLLAQKDTIGIQEIDKRLFGGEPKLYEILVHSEFRPTNFFYSNVFKYKRKPFSGVAIGNSEMQQHIILELTNGRIQRIRQYDRAGHITYKFDRIDSNLVLAIDSSFTFGSSLQWRYATKMTDGRDELRINFQTPYNRIYNGVFYKCDGGDFCTDDHWSYLEVKKGFQKEATQRGWKQGDYESFIGGTRWMEYSMDSFLLATYFEDDKGRKQGLYMEFWPSGKQAVFGYFENDLKTGRWKYFDSTAAMVREEWYSIGRAEPDDWNLDSSKTYYPDSALKLFEKGIYVEFRQYDYDDSSQFEVDWHYQQLRIEYYNSGQRKSLQQYGCYDTDTLLACWYSNGQLSRLELSDRISREYYSNGQLKSSGLPFVNAGARNGDIKEFDSTGRVLIDRTYVDGKVVAVRDSLAGKMNEERERISDSLAGAAVIGCFPENYVSTGVNQPWLNYGKSNIPSWKDSVFIPSEILDSLSYVVAGVFMKFPDSLHAVRDSIFQYASEFHPSKHVWIYTVSAGMADTSSWIEQCRNGMLLTDNPSVDQYLDGIGYNIISWEVAGYPHGHVWDSGRYVPNYSCRATISVRQPLNFIYFKQLDTDSYRWVQIKCGDETDYSYQYRLSRRCRKDYNNHREDQVCVDENYLSFNVLSKPSKYGRLEYKYFFIINSDSQVDLKFRANETSHYWYGKDNSYFLDY